MSTEQDTQHLGHVNRTIAALSMALASGTALGDVEIDLSDPAQCRFGAWTLVERIGGGGMGVVYRAHQESLERDVAIKLLNVHSGDDGQALARFRFEAKSAAALNHPNIVQVLEIGQEQGIAFIAMQLVRGQTLADRILAAPIAPKETVALMLKLCEAVGYAHKLHLLHLDLKPANVLMDERGEPLVADFGLARRMNSQGQVQAQEVSGTPAYMAPEQMLIKEFRLSAATDIYALGAILYEMLCGVSPHGRGASADVMQRALAGQIPPPTRLNPKVPRDLEAICLKCLALRAADRYESVEALADDLRRYANALPVSVRPINAFQRLGRWARRDPRLATAMSLLLFVLLGGIIATTWQWRRANTAALRAEEDTRRIKSAVRLIAGLTSSEVIPPKELPAALDMLHNQLQGQRDTEVDILADLGMQVNLQGNPRDGLSIIEKAIAIAKQYHGASDDRLPNLYWRAAWAAHSVGDLKSAERNYRMYLDRLGQKYGQSSIKYAHAAPHLALNLLDLGEPAEAENYARPALQVLESKWGANQDWTMLAAYALGRAYLDEGKPQEAIPLLKRSAETYESLYSHEEGIAIYARYYLGLAQVAMGDKAHGSEQANTSLAEAAVYQNPDAHLMGRPLLDAVKLVRSSKHQ